MGKSLGSWENSLQLDLDAVGPKGLDPTPLGADYKAVEHTFQVSYPPPTHPLHCPHIGPLCCLWLLGSPEFCAITPIVPNRAPKHHGNYLLICQSDLSSCISHTIIFWVCMLWNLPFLPAWRFYLEPLFWSVLLALQTSAESLTPWGIQYGQPSAKVMTPPLCSFRTRELSVSHKLRFCLCTDFPDCRSRGGVSRTLRSSAHEREDTDKSIKMPKEQRLSMLFPSSDCPLGPYPSTEPCNFSVLLKATNRLRKKKGENTRYLIFLRKESVYDRQKMCKLQHRLFVTKSWKG